MFEHIEIAELVYEGGTLSKITKHTANSNRNSHDRKRKGRKAALSTNPEKGRSRKRKKNQAGYLSNCPTGEKYVCCMDPDTPNRSVKYLRNTLTIMPYSGLTKTKNPSTTAEISVVSMISSTVTRRRRITWHPNLNLTKKKKEKKTA